MESLILAAVNWKRVGLVLGIIAAIAVVFAILILIITKLCKIKEDEKVAKILENLAGANCGGCGHSGCEGFAKAVAEGKANLAGCQVTSEEAKQIIAKIAGINYSSKEKTVAVVRCSGGIYANDKYEYSGNTGCINIKVLRNGQKACEYGCLGGGTCTTKCPTGAIKLTKDKTPFVDKSLCISCGACMLACPKYTVTRIPLSAKVYVACNSKCKGKDVMSVCKNG
ncbi:MAG: 4Fe-4S binding protein, partial [Clostridia bacterium]|nr:4Fe-4S binding protein [Clostridia bacterium]